MLQSLLLNRTARKLFAALWFSTFAFLAMGALFLHLPIAARGVLLYLALPAVASALSGFFWGDALLDPGKIEGYGSCVLRGLAVTGGAFAIFALLFACALPLTEHGWGFGQIAGLFMTTVILGLLMTGPIIAAAGTLAAVTLYALGRRVVHDRGGRGPQETAQPN